MDFLIAFYEEEWFLVCQKGLKDLNYIVSVLVCWEKYPHRKTSGLKSECCLRQEDSNKSSGNDLRDDLSRERLILSQMLCFFFVKRESFCLSFLIPSFVYFPNMLDSFGLWFIKWVHLNMLSNCSRRERLSHPVNKYLMFQESGTRVFSYEFFFFLHFFSLMTTMKNKDKYMEYN